MKDRMLHTKSKNLTWADLTKSQAKVADDLALLIANAVKTSQESSVEEGTRVAFLSGRRGTGKTTILRLFQEAVSPTRRDTRLPEFPNVRELLNENSSKKNIFWLEPIPLDPLPAGSNITGAVLSRLSDASQIVGRGSQRAAGVLDPVGGLDRARNELNSLQSKALLAIEGNLEQRRGATDPDTFAVSVMDNERSRPTIRNKLSKILERIVSHGSEEMVSSVQGLYVVVIDDIDIRPSRAVEALQLAALLAIPRLFFIFSGEIDTVDQLLLYRTQREFLEAFGQKTLDPFLRDDIEGRANEIASSLLRKLVPPKQQLRVGAVTFSEDTGLIRELRDDTNLSLGESRYIDGDWNLTQLISNPEDVFGAEQVLCVAPRQLKDLHTAFQNLKKLPVKDAAPSVEPRHLLNKLWPLFSTLVDEDPKLGIPAQRKLKAILDEAVLEPEDATEEPNEATVKPNRGRPVVFPVDGISIDAQFGEGVTVEVEPLVAKPGVTDETKSLMTEPGIIVTVRGNTVTRRDLKIKARGRGDSKKLETRPFGPDAAAMFMLLHDVCATSQELDVDGEFRWTKGSQEKLAQTSWETLDGKISWVVPWQTLTWPTFRHQQIFLNEWNKIVRRVRIVQREPSTVTGDDIARVLAVGYAEAVARALALTFPELGRSQDEHLLHPVGSIAAAIDGAKGAQKVTKTAKTAKTAEPMWTMVGRNWTFTTDDAIKPRCKLIWRFVDELLAALAKKTEDGEEDSRFELGIAVVAEIRWLFSSHVHVLAKHVNENAGNPKIRDASGARASVHLVKVKTRINRLLERREARLMAGLPSRKKSVA